jgi:hypothetical protein
MLLDKRFLFGVLNGTITVYFTKILQSDLQKARRIVDLKEHNIRLLNNPKANFKYGVVEVVSARPSKIKDFIQWCKDMYGLRSENDEIGVASIEIHVIKKQGKEVFKELGLAIPTVRW